MKKTSNLSSETFLKDAQIKTPVICGAMYPCSNPELLAAVSKAGGLAVIQPMTLTFVHGLDLRLAIRKIRKATSNPLAFNAIIEKSVERYEKRMNEWVDIALEEGIRFFITALGNPKKMVEKVHAAGGIVYHDVTNRKWAEKAVQAGVDGLICVNNRAGGHVGEHTPEQLFADLKSFNLPLICAGGVGTPEQYKKMLKIGYQGVQMGTRFIATEECSADQNYKKAIHEAKEENIVHSVRLTGVPVSIIETDFVKKTGTNAGFIMKRLLTHPKFKHYARLYYSVKAIFKLKKASVKGTQKDDFFQAGKSVSGIFETKKVSEVIAEFDKAYQELS